MRKTFKYRLLAGKQTFQKAEHWLDLCRNLYNTALEQRISTYRSHHRSITCYDQIKQLPEMKVAFPEYKEVDAQTLQEALERLDGAYQAFFRRIKNGNGKAGFPHFKGKRRYNSFTLKQWSWKLDGKHLIIRNMGRFKLRLSRPIEGSIKTITIKRTSTNKWYVCFFCDNVPEKRLSKSGKIIGIDVGIKSFLVDSEGNRVGNPRYFRQSERLLRRRQRILCRRTKGSNGRRQTRLLVAKAHEKVKSQRLDFLHKVANLYIKNYGTICIEDLNIKGMLKNHTLAKSIGDAGWGTFFELLSYKAEEAGRELIQVPQFEPTSKRCSVCGTTNQDLTLSDRQWVCKVCGAVHDRDFNSAKNICRVGQTLRASTKDDSLCVARESLIFNARECQEAGLNQLHRTPLPGDFEAHFDWLRP